MTNKHLLALLTLSAFATIAYADNDGSKLWFVNNTKANAKVVVKTKATSTTDIAVNELRDAWHGGQVTLERKSAKGLTRESFTVSQKGGNVTITSPSDAGLMYGAYHLLRLEQPLGKDAPLRGAPKQQDLHLGLPLQVSARSHHTPALDKGLGVAHKHAGEHINLTLT